MKDFLKGFSDVVLGDTIFPGIPNLITFAAGVLFVKLITKKQEGSQVSSVAPLTSPATQFQEERALTPREMAM